MPHPEPCIVTDMVTTDATFEHTSWHDNFIYGIHFDAHEFESDLRLELDHIVKWVQPDAVRFQFWIAPAVLVFHGVTDLALHVDFGDTGHQQTLTQLSIHTVFREEVVEKKAFFDQPYFAWRIVTNWPEGEITFGATGYTQTLLAQPVLCDGQFIEADVRRGLVKRSDGGE